MSKLSAQHVLNQRTNDPKYSHYYSDGSGRDTYLVYNNGGFSVPRTFNAIAATAFMKTGRVQQGLVGGHSSINTSP